MTSTALVSNIGWNTKQKQTDIFRRAYCKINGPSYSCGARFIQHFKFSSF